MNKKIFITSALSLSLLLSACGKKDTAKGPELNSNSSVIESNENDEDMMIFNEETKKSKETPVVVDKESMKSLMSESDYITRVKIQVDAENKTTTNFIEDFKGDLSNVEITLPKTLTPSREYLVFYRDGADGNIVPTNTDKSFIEIQGSDDGNLNYIEANYIKDIKSDNKSTIKDINNTKSTISTKESDNDNNKNTKSTTTTKVDSSKESEKESSKSSTNTLKVDSNTKVDNTKKVDSTKKTDTSSKEKTTVSKDKESPSSKNSKTPSKKL